METVIGAITKQHGLLVVGALVEVVSQFVMDGVEIFRSDVDAHLDPEIINVIDIPRAGVTHHLAVSGLHRTGSVPKMSWEGA